MRRSNRAPAAACAAVVVAIIAVLIAVLWRGGRTPRRRDAFYTSAAREEPTRSETPYVGTIPFGPWGVLPWALGPGAPRPAAGGC
jgi:hypothetical protein